MNKQQGCLQSFISVSADSDFPIQNLPYSIFSTHDDNTPRVCSAIGDYVIDLSYLAKAGFFKDVLPNAVELFSEATLNAFMAQGKNIWQTVRDRLTHLLDKNNPELRDSKQHHLLTFISMQDVILHMPIAIGDYTDFYSSIDHARNVGTMFRDKDHPLLPNYLHIPVGYHGRASTIVISDTPIKRPAGQILPKDADAPIFTETKRLDFELEMAFVVGTGNKMGEPITIDNAYDHIFGLTLMNDWSARDIQKWEYVPLGPFLSKSFATTISPWIVPLLALESFKTKPMKQNPTPLDYLQFANDYSFDITLQAHLATQDMQQADVICTTNFKNLYWTMAQQLAHHTVNGCEVRTGDLMASGTISGNTPDSYGSLLELSWNGEKPLSLSTGETRTFLQDGDTLTLTGYGQGDGYRIGFGQARGKITI